MNHPPIPPWIILLLLAGASILPVAVCLVLVLSALLGAMGDANGAQVLVYVGWAIGGLWGVCLTALVFALALRTLFGPEDRQDSPHEGRLRRPDDPDSKSP